VAYCAAEREYGLRVRGVDADERREQSDKYLKAVGLAEFADRYPKDLRAAVNSASQIARTLINNRASY